jgi:hypothetical protein
MSSAPSCRPEPNRRPHDSHRYEALVTGRDRRGRDDLQTLDGCGSQWTSAPTRGSAGHYAGVSPTHQAVLCVSGAQRSWAVPGRSSRGFATGCRPYRPARRSGSRVFQAFSAALIYWIAVSSVNGGSGGRASDVWTPGGHAACQESDRAADPTRSLPARSPTCWPASSQRRPPKTRRRPSSPDLARHPRVGRTLRLRELGNRHSNAEHRGLSTTLVNTNQVFGIQPWMCRARHGLSSILTNDRSRSGQPGKV